MALLSSPADLPFEAPEHRTHRATFLAYLRRIVAPLFRNCASLPADVPQRRCPIRQGNVPLRCHFVSIRVFVPPSHLPLDRGRSRRAAANQHAQTDLCSDTFALLYALQDRMFTRIGRWLTGGALICNGRELARAFQSPRTIAAVSSTVQETEFFPRIDTCQGQTVRILFVGYIRPEKGIEYLLYAVNQLIGKYPVGARDCRDPISFQTIAAVSTKSSSERGIQDRVHWTGYMLRTANPCSIACALPIFLFSPLCPREHRMYWWRPGPTAYLAYRPQRAGCPAQSSMNTTRCSCLPKIRALWPMRSNGCVRDGELRRTLIRNGFEAARRQTLERFIARVLRELEPNLETAKAAVPQE